MAGMLQRLRKSGWRAVYHCHGPQQGLDEKDGILGVTYVVCLIDFGLVLVLSFFVWWE